MDVSQCILNKVILQVASKYVVSDNAGSILTLFLALGTKVFLRSGLLSLSVNERAYAFACAHTCTMYSTFGHRDW